MSTSSCSRTEPIRRTILRLLSSFRWSRAERELAHEIRSHLQLLADQHIARGMDAEEARYAVEIRSMDVAANVQEEKILHDFVEWR